jgi:hypothetical protein
MKSIHLIVFYLFGCASQEYKLLGITSKEKEMKYFGKSFSTSLQKLDREQIEKIKVDLKNSYALQKIENPEMFWNELDSISVEKNEFLLFQINPETRVFAEFLFFVFTQARKNVFLLYGINSEEFESANDLYGSWIRRSICIYKWDLSDRDRCEYKIKASIFFSLKVF